jgi:hypothetical protein
MSVLETRGRETKDGLLGFDRTQELSTQPAHEIAAIAQQFGQQDDIPVVTLTRMV